MFICASFSLYDNHPSWKFQDEVRNAIFGHDLAEDLCRSVNYSLTKYSEAPQPSSLAMDRLVWIRFAAQSPSNQLRVSVLVK